MKLKILSAAVAALVTLFLLPQAAEAQPYTRNPGVTLVSERPIQLVHGRHHYYHGPRYYPPVYYYGHPQYYYRPYNPGISLLFSFNDNDRQRHHGNRHWNNRGRDWDHDRGRGRSHGRH